VTVTIKKDLAAEIDAFVEKQGGNLGLDSRAQMVVAAIREYIEAKKPRFKHINTFEDHAIIADFERRDFVTILFHENGSAWCDADKSETCIHVDYALTVPSIIEKLKEHGWKHR
jgi:hypothetical protein